MELIKLNQSNKEAFEKLFKFSYPNENEEEMEWLDLYLKNERIWDDAYGWFDGDTLVSSYCSYSGQYMIRDEAFNVKFIENVATLPPYRNKGLIRKGLKKELENNYDSQFHLLCLGPFKHEFYRKLGFETATDSKSLKLDFDFLSKKLDFRGYRTKIGLINQDSTIQDDINHVKKWFWEHARYNQGKYPEIFDEVHFQMTKRYVAIAYDEKSVPKGYMIFSEKDQNLKITNMNYIDLQAFYALKQFLLSYQDQIKGIHITNIPPDFPIDLLIDNFWLAGKKLSLEDHGWHMFRIVNLEKVLSKICKKFPNQDIYLKVSDDILHKNNRIFHFSKSKIECVESYSGKNDASISISDLVPLVTGRKSSFELYMSGKLTVPGKSTIYNSKNLAPPIISEFDKIFPQVKTFSIN